MNELLCVPFNSISVNRELDETQRLHRFSVQCYHGDYYSDCYNAALDKYILPFLMNTWNGTAPEDEIYIEPVSGLGTLPKLFRE